MNRMTDNKIVLITQKTRLEDLIYRHNSIGQAKFYIEHHGGDFSDYEVEHSKYQESISVAKDFLEKYGRLQVIDRGFVSNFMFGKDDLVVAIGRDGLIANTMKYLDGQMLIGVNPDPTRWDGVLLPFVAEDLKSIIPEVQAKKRNVKAVTLAKVSLNDGQELYGVNDIFIGQKTHTSARYEISFRNKKETQSSSGIIVSTGLGATGWLKSIISGAAGIDKACGLSQKPLIGDEFHWDSNYLYFTVREPYPSTSTGADIVFGKIEENEKFIVTSNMPENGVIFSDGMEQDYLQFNSGSTAEITIAEKTDK